MTSGVDDKLVKKAYQKLKYTKKEIEELASCMHPTNGPLYFMSNFMYVQHTTKGQIKFEPFSYQLDLIDCYHNYRKSCNLLGRQMGKTTVAGGYLLWYGMFVPDSTILIAAHKHDGALEIMDRIRYAYESLPDHIRAGVVTYNKKSIKFDNGSRIVATTTTENTGRGMSISLCYIDEFAFVNPTIARGFYTSLSPTLATGGKCIITSTPDTDEDQFAKIWFEANSLVDENGNEREVGKNGFKPYFADWSAHPERDQAWADEQIADLGQDRFDREHGAKFVSFEETLINAAKISQLKGIDPVTRYDNVRWYTNTVSSTSTYVVSLDPSMGTGGDYAAIQVYEMPTLNQVAEWQSNTTPIESQIKVLRDILVELQSRGASELYWSVENNTLGEACLVVIRDTGEENFPGTMLHDPKNKSGGKRKGFTTTHRSKMEACAKLKQLVENGKLKINSRNLISELKMFVARSNTYEAKLGQTDDLISATLLFLRMADYIASWDDTSYRVMNSKLEIDSHGNDDSPMPILI